MHSGVVLCCVDVHGCVMLALTSMRAQWSCPVLCCVDVHGCVMVVLACMHAQWSFPVLCVVGLQSYFHVVPNENHPIVVGWLNDWVFFSNS